MRNWEQLLFQLGEMIERATATGIRYRVGSKIFWDIYPFEYLKITRQLAEAPAGIQDIMRGITA